MTFITIARFPVADYISDGVTENVSNSWPGCLV